MALFIYVILGGNKHFRRQNNILAVHQGGVCDRRGQYRQKEVPLFSDCGKGRRISGDVRLNIHKRSCGKNTAPLNYSLFLSVLKFRRITAPSDKKGRCAPHNITIIPQSIPVCQYPRRQNADFLPCVQKSDVKFIQNYVLQKEKICVTIKMQERKVHSNEQVTFKALKNRLRNVAPDCRN